VRFIYYTNVGDMSPTRAETHCRKISDIFTKGQEAGTGWLKHGESILVVPVRGDVHDHLESVPD
jgi:hypothetical protein